MHDDVKRFSLDGETGDNNIVEERERLIRFLEGVMRDEGYTPLLDILPQFTLDFNKEAETFNFALSIYGTYVGEDKSWEAAGVMDGKMIMSTMLLDRSSRSLTNVDSKLSPIRIQSS